MTDERPAPRRWRLWAVLIVVGATYAGAAYQAFAVVRTARPWNWRDMVVGGVLWATAVGVLRLLQEVGWTPFWPEYPERRVEAAVVRAGVLPPGADVEEWSVRLSWLSEQLRRDRWVVAGACVAIGALVAAAAMESRAGAPGVWALAAALATFAVVPFLWLSGRLGATERLLAELPLSGG